MAEKSTRQRFVETLQNALSQTTETVTRTARLDISGSGVDEIDPPEDIDEYWNQYQTTGIVRANINQFISDVVEPGARVEAGDDTTKAYFMGETDELTPPEFAPEGGFLENCAIYSGERKQPFYPFLKTTIANRWVRGTILIELLKADREDPESQITGFYHIRPETIYPQVYANKNILLDPDPDAPINEGVNYDLTPRGEVAAYIQFDDRSIIGRKLKNGFDKDEVPLSQNDVIKQVLNPDIGGDDALEQGIFGTSILDGVSTDIEEYKNTKRDQYRALQHKAYGVWLINFKEEFIGEGNDKQLVGWDQEGQSDVMDTMEGLQPGEYISADGPIDLEKFEPDIPDLDHILDHYIDSITAPLPAPKYSVGFEENINQFVTENQQERYRDIVSEERRYQERKWTKAFKQVARRHPDLNAEGLRVLIQPKEEESPVKSLSEDEITKIQNYAKALSTMAGPTKGPTTIVDEKTLRDLILQLPEDARPDMEGLQLDESNSEVQQQFSNQFGLDTLGNRYSEGDVVMTPQGIGVVVGVFTESFDADGETIKASSNSPTYAVALKDARIGSEFYSASQLEEREEIDSGIEDPVSDVEAMADIQSATGGVETMSAWNMPESWEEADKPARLILLDAWASMNAQFNCGGGCCMGELHSKRMCAAMKDEVTGTTNWRDWGN